ncbi:hypothetical protein PABG_11863 [Paracoccidioides brasiliensis Pb03]|nr:hypothetical protein PABG_11863 [Paracoccidioides brasiliensis Pb03]
MHLIFTGATDLVGFGVLNQMLPLIPGRTSKLTILSRGPADIEKARRSRGLCVGPKAYPNHWLIKVLQQSQGKFTQTFAAVKGKCEKALLDMAKAKHIFQSLFPPANHVDPSM